MSGRALVLAAAALWSSGGLLILQASAWGAHPAAIACVRSAVAAFVLGWAIPSARRAIGARAMAASLCFTGIVGGFVAATALTSAAHAVFLQYVYPLMVAVVARDRLSARTWLAVALGAAGIGVILSESIGALSGVGLALGLGSAVMFTAFVLLQRGMHDANPVGLAAFYNVVAAAVLAAFAWPHLAIEPRAWALIALMGVVQLGLPYVLFLRGLRSVPATDAALLTLLEPVLNPIWVFLALGARPGPWTLAGGGVLMLALVLRITEKADPD